MKLIPLLPPCEYGMTRVQTGDNLSFVAFPACGRYVKNELYEEAIHYFMRAAEIEPDEVP